MIGPFEFAAAFLLDFVIGDPKWLPHPVRIMGRAIVYLENMLRRIFGKRHEKAAGVVLAILTVTTSCLSAIVFEKTLRLAETGILSMLSIALIVYASGTTIALRELVNAAGTVLDFVKKGDLNKAKAGLSMIVGRDTDVLSQDGVLRATIETLSENLSDGVIAPMFYLVIGGLPLAIAYKAINTLDSMVGYKNEKYMNLGWASARLDDIANYLPARLSGLLIALSTFIIFLFRDPFNSLRLTCRSLRIMLRDGRKHTSPNSGVPEAAIAGALGVRLGGPSTYGGRIVEKPYIGDPVNADYLSASSDTIDIVMVSSLFAAMTGSALLYLRGAL